MTFIHLALEQYQGCCPRAPTFSAHGQAARAPLDATSLEQQLLSRLVALNHERAAEEKRGLIRWLRPDYQARGTAASDGHRPPLQTEIGLDDSTHLPSTIHDPLSKPSVAAVPHHCRSHCSLVS
ncbi:MAG: hypothetical protein NTW21_16190 [Verrucomicrobia bacterium]|nr:hypothetical protein [Verrucomicrobiota bacterium]